MPEMKRYQCVFIIKNSIAPEKRFELTLDAQDAVEAESVLKVLIPDAVPFGATQIHSDENY